MNPNGAFPNQNGNQNLNNNPQAYPQNPGQTMPEAPVFEAPQNTIYTTNRYPQNEQLQGPDPRMQAFFNQAEVNSKAQQEQMYSAAQPQMQPQAQMPMPQPMPTMPAPQQPQIQVKKKSHALEIVLIIFIFLIGAGAIGAAAYCQSQYSALQEDVNSKTSVAINKAKQAQKAIDDKAYEVRNASNLKEFTGPSDFGAITFKYPKTWNIYLKNNDDTNPSYEAYFSPTYVPSTIMGNSVFALSFKIEGQDYNSYMKKYENKKLSSASAFSINGLSGSKIMGKLDEKAEQPNGAEVVLQINNYVAVIRTYDYDLYGAEFDAILADLASANY